MTQTNVLLKQLQIGFKPVVLSQLAIKTITAFSSSARHLSMGQKNPGTLQSHYETLQASVS
jgi:hypothetical protein